MQQKLGYIATASPSAGTKSAAPNPAPNWMLTTPVSTVSPAIT
ncbi:MAG TPA: hypothetical protein VJ821_04295 [Anaerolineales bacterium]|nr:hypothetical protein [Anaerolineales bacterium]